MTVALEASPPDDPVLAANPGLAGDPLLLAIWQRVQSIEDPCHELSGYPLTLVDLGVINRVDFDAGHVEIGLTYTELGCSFAPRILQRIEQEMLAVPGVASVEAVYEPFPPWSPDRMSTRAQQLYATRREQARAAIAAIPVESIKSRRSPPSQA
jgi:metal-sulfur cluster biosynthetic enzyme